MPRKAEPRERFKRHLKEGQLFSTEFIFLQLLASDFIFLQLLASDVILRGPVVIYSNASMPSAGVM